MRRALTTTAFAVAALTAAAPASAAAPAAARLVECSVQNHEATFQGRMRQVEGASRMAMRFKLIAETGGDNAAEVRAPELRRWYFSKPGVRAFRYRQGFRNLAENVIYRVRVSFRWYAEDGSLVERAARRSPACRQFVELPNLAVRLTRFSETRLPGVWRYRARVTNTGRGAATEVPLKLTVDGDVVDTVTFASLAAGESRSVGVLGPKCRRGAKLEVDPDRAITETTEEDNVFEVNCAGLNSAG